MAKYINVDNVEKTYAIFIVHGNGVNEGYRGLTFAEAVAKMDELWEEFPDATTIKMAAEGNNG